MAKVFFPSCKAVASYPEASKKLAAYLKDKYQIDPIGCCKVKGKMLNDDDQAILVCLNCSRVLEGNQQEFIWNIIDQDDNFIFHDYHGIQMTLQDCHLANNKQEVKKAIRSLMKKMNIDTVENEALNDHCPSYEIAGYHLKQKLTEEEKKAYFTNKYNKATTDVIVSYCKYCNDGVLFSNKQGKHILELLFPIK